MHSAYVSLSLQWEVATLALDVLYKLLSSHEFTEDDFQDSTYQLPNREVATVPKSPGHSLLVHLMNNSQVLRKVKLIYKYTPPPPPPPPKTSLAYCSYFFPLSTTSPPKRISQYNWFQFLITLSWGKLFMGFLHTTSLISQICTA